MVDMLYSLICFICVNILIFVLFQTLRSKVQGQRKMLHSQVGRRADKGTVRKSGELFDCRCKGNHP